MKKEILVTILATTLALQVAGITGSNVVQKTADVIGAVLVNRIQTDEFVYLGGK